MTEVNPKVTVIAINNNAGLMTNIVLTIMCSKVTVIEDPGQNNGVAQGLQGYYIDTQPGVGVPPIEPGGGAPPQASPSNLMTWLPNTNGQQGRAFEPIIFGGSDGRVHGGEGSYVGAQGTVVLQLRTNSENATNVLLEEWS